MKLIVTVKGMGTFSIELWPQLAPQACAHVVTVADYMMYNGRRIERFEPGFVIQPLFCDGEDPLLDELIELEAKTIPENGSIPFERGIVAMAGTSDRASAAQYFITLGTHERLNGNFTIIGKIADGWDVIEQIESIPAVEGTIVEDGQEFKYHYPSVDVIIEKVEIEE